MNKTNTAPFRTAGGRECIRLSFRAHLVTCICPETHDIPVDKVRLAKLNGTETTTQRSDQRSSLELDRCNCLVQCVDPNHNTLTLLPYLIYHVHGVSKASASRNCSSSHPHSWETIHRNIVSTQQSSNNVHTTPSPPAAVLHLERIHSTYIQQLINLLEPTHILNAFAKLVQRGGQPTFSPLSVASLIFGQRLNNYGSHLPDVLSV